MKRSVDSTSTFRPGAAPGLSFDRQTLRTLDQAALGDVAGGTTVGCATAIVVVTIWVQQKAKQMM